jgi:predicted dehydrogenase
MKIGIIGAENSHTAAIAKTLNVKRSIGGFTVAYVWGETEAFAKAAAEAGKIPVIVKDPAEMMGKVDALIVDHRHAKYHLEAVLPFVKKGMPVFVDKPFCYRAAEGKAFLAAARAAGAPVTSFSAMVHQKSFERFKKDVAGLGEIAGGTLFGPCDIESQYGGVFFYGVHQVEMALAAFGQDVVSAQIVRGGGVSLGRLVHASGRVVTLHLVSGKFKGFAASVFGSGGHVFKALPMDRNPYLSGIRVFTTMFKTGKEPLPHDHLLKPVQVLEALEKSVTSGKAEPVES